MDEHVALVDNTSSAEKLIHMQWTSPDDFWFVQITQRKKDYRSYNRRHGGNAMWWKRVNGIDGTSRENFAGYGVVSGNTADEAVESLKNITINLNPWAQKIVGTNVVTSNGNMEAVRDVCDKLYARSYISINKRSMSHAQQRVQIWNAKGKGERAFEKHASRNREDPRDEKYYPYVLIDNDIDNQQAWQEIGDYLKKKNYNPVFSLPSHDGQQIIMDNPAVANDRSVDFTPFFRKYATNNKPGDPPILIKRDAKMILYSPCGR